LEPAAVEIRSEGATRRGIMVETDETIIIGEAEKMSKSKRNVVAPADIADAYGVDAARLFVLSDSPPERDVQWTNAGVEGAWRLINRIWAEFDESPKETADREPDDAATLTLRRGAHRATKAVTEAIEGFRFNSAVARLYEFVTVLRNSRAAACAPEARREALSILARLVAPFAPHLAEEGWRRLGNVGMVTLEPWPTWDAGLVEDETRVLPVQINGKRRGEVQAPAGASSAEVETLVYANDDIAKRLDGLTVRKFIVVTDRIVNVVAD
jgi:leucyl-tRNA synthetase